MLCVRVQVRFRARVRVSAGKLSLIDQDEAARVRVRTHIVCYKCNHEATPPRCGGLTPDPNLTLILN